MNNMDHNRLCSLMDKLAAIQMDLKPLCSGQRATAAPAAAHAIIAEACEILKTAIGDLREVIGNLDGMTESDAPRPGPIHNIVRS